MSPVFAEDSPEFVACQQIMPAGDFKLLKQKKNCFRDVARALQDQLGDSMQPVAPSDSSGGEVDQLDARIAELESQVATLTTINAEFMEQVNKDAQEEMDFLNCLMEHTKGETLLSCGQARRNGSR